MKVSNDFLLIIIVVFYFLYPSNLINGVSFLIEKFRKEFEIYLLFYNCFA